MNIDAKPMLHVMCGLSGSGKSSVAKDLAKRNNAIIVSSNEIREEITGTVEDQSKNNEVFQIFHKRIKQNLISGRDVIADATNLTMRDRRALLNPLQGMDIVKICVVTTKKYEDCLEDNKNRCHPVPEEVIKKQMCKFQVPFLEEGFDYICSHFDSFNAYPDTFEKEFNLMAGLEQKNPHHTLTLGEHCTESYLRLVKQTFDNIHSSYLIGARLHDIGKVFTQTFDDQGIAHYYNHENVGSYYLLSHYASYSRIINICFLVNYHMLPFQWDTEKIRKKYRRIFGKYKYELLMDFHKCDLSAK